jgi:hypothetical protein
MLACAFMLALVVDVGCGGGAGSRDAAGSAGVSGEAGTSGAAGSSAGTGPDGSATGGAGTGASPDARCSSTGLPPDLLLLLDRSGSMSQALDGTVCPSVPVDPPCVSRWTDVTKAVNDVVQEGEGTMRWGLKYFPSSGSGASCIVESGVAVPVADRNAAAVAASIAATTPSGRTPTRLAVQSAAAYLLTLTDPNPKVIVLATDGAPNCGPGQANTALSDSAGTVATIKAVADNGIPVYVIGIGTFAEENAILRDMAVAGGRAQAAEPRYYPVTSSADLVAALRTIGAQVAADAGAVTTCP